MLIQHILAQSRGVCEGIANRAYEADEVELDALFPQVLDHAFHQDQRGAVDAAHSLRVHDDGFQGTLPPGAV